MPQQHTARRRLSGFQHARRKVHVRKLEPNRPVAVIQRRIAQGSAQREIGKQFADSCSARAQRHIQPTVMTAHVVGIHEGFCQPADIARRCFKLALEHDLRPFDKNPDIALEGHVSQHNADWQIQPALGEPGFDRQGFNLHRQSIDPVDFDPEIDLHRFEIRRDQIGKRRTRPVFCLAFSGLLFRFRGIDRIPVLRGCLQRWRTFEQQRTRIESLGMQRKPRARTVARQIEGRIAVELGRPKQKPLDLDPALVVGKQGVGLEAHRRKWCCPVAQPFPEFVLAGQLQLESRFASQRRSVQPGADKEPARGTGHNQALEQPCSLFATPAFDFCRERGVLVTAVELGLKLTGFRQLEIEIGYRKAPLVTAVGIGDYRGYIIEFNLVDGNRPQCAFAPPVAAVRRTLLVFSPYPPCVAEPRAGNGDPADTQALAQQGKQPHIAREVAHLQVNVGTVYAELIDRQARAQGQLEIAAFSKAQLCIERLFDNGLDHRRNSRQRHMNADPGKHQDHEKKADQAKPQPAKHSPEKA